MFEFLKDNYEKSIQLLSKAIEPDSEYAAAFCSRATLHTKMGNEDLAVGDIQMVQFLTHINIEYFANQNNIWRSQHLRLEAMTESEMTR